MRIFLARAKFLTIFVIFSLKLNFDMRGIFGQVSLSSVNIFSVSVLFSPRRPVLEFW